MRTLRLALAQINPTVGDLVGNKKRILDYLERSREVGADIVAFPELAITGYPPEDLLFKPEFIEANLRCLEEIVEASSSIICVVGFADRADDIYNAAAIICDGRLCGVYHKSYLPNYGVFDENRYFQPGSESVVFAINGMTAGVNICEDIWYPGGPTKVQALAGDAEIIINISSSPYHAGKGSLRERILSTRAFDNTAIVAMVNVVGGQDELVFDGGSLIFDEGGELIARGKQFEEDLIVADLDADAVFRQRLHDPRRRGEKESLEDTLRRIELSPIELSHNKPPLPERNVESNSRLEEIYNALVLGVRDYVKKNRCERVLVGLSGGIDSSLAAVIAVDALGPENVVGVTMPSVYSSEGTKSDSLKLAKNLEIELITLRIDAIFETYIKTLEEEFRGLEPGVAEENIQARIRGNLLMALSNKFGWLVLVTGNKSETGVGYATLYGDMAGGFSVIKDIYKTLVYELSEYRNSKEGIEIIPKSVIKREPSAELKPDQRDVDSLPPYSTLDPILEAYVEQDRSLQEIVSLGFDEAVVKRVIEMVDRNEYKRRQAPPGIKITPRAFGKDRRLPITNRNTVDSRG